MNPAVTLFLINVALPVGIFVLLVGYPSYRICKKAGFRPALAILSVLPLVLLWVLALAEWPSLKRRD